MIPLTEIEAARDRIAGAAVRTPLVRLPDTDIWLKLENLQPVSSFKIRAATNAIRAASPDQLKGGVVTASAGNMAQGVAWAAREAGVPATIICPDGAPQTKLDRIERLGGRVIQVPWEQWWQTIVDARFEGVDGLFIHPVQDERVMAGNGTIGLELVEDLPDLDTVLVPYGGGGLSVGIASAVKQLRPGVKVYAVDPENGPSASAAFAAGEPTVVEHTKSFVDGSGRLDRGDGRRAAADGRAGARDRRGRGRARAGRCALRPGGRRQDRRDRLRREHRLLRADADPRGRDADVGLARAPSR